MARVSRTEREARAIMVAEHRLQQRMETIAFEEEVLYPALERVKSGALTLRLKDGAVERRELGA